MLTYRAKQLEFLGLLMLLVAFLWEVFVANLLGKQFDSVNTERLEHKLDVIHQRQQAIADAVQSEAFQIRQNIAGERHRDAFDLSSLKPSGSHGVTLDWPPGADYSRLHRQTEVSQVVRAILFALGTVVLLLGKALEAAAAKRETHVVPVEKQ